MRRKSRLWEIFVSLLLLLIASSGAFYNFFLIRGPITAFFSGDDSLGNLGAMAVILTGIVLGLVIMDSRQATRLFAFFGKLRVSVRSRVFKIALTLLVLLASFEGYLGFFQNALFRQMVFSIKGAMPPPDLEQLLSFTALGFILPLALAFTAFPITSLVKALLEGPLDPSNDDPDALLTEQ